MSRLMGRNSQRLFSGLWLLLYAAAGLLVHAPIGHVHHHSHGSTDHAHFHLLATSDHSHLSHNHAPGHHHAHQTADSTDSERHEHGQSEEPFHDDECAGCQLLGSLSTPTAGVELVDAGRLNLSAPVLVEVSAVAEVIGISLARAPPAMG